MRTMAGRDRDGPDDAADGTAWDGTARSPGARTVEEAGEVAAVLAAQHDLARFEPVYRRYHRPVFDFCHRRLGDRERAEDATGQTFARALAGIHGFRSGSVPAWLFTIARHTVIDAVRTHRPHVGLDAVPLIADAAPGPEEHLLAADRRRALTEAMTRLTGDQRAIVELRWAGLTGPEIAETLGLSLAATKSGQYRAYARLRTLLGDRLRDDPPGDTP